MHVCIQYIKNTFNSAKDSISVNGMDSHEMEAELAKAQEGEEIEPFDTKLAQRMQALSAQIEHHTLQLAILRRNAPVQTSQRFQEEFNKRSEARDTQLAKNEKLQFEEARNTTIDVGEVQRLDEMQSTWENGTDSLSGLKSGLGGTVARMEKAQQAVNILQER